MSKDSTLVEKVHKLIIGNLQDPDFHSEDICNILKVSRAKLYRTLKEETGKSYQEIYSEIRIQKAYELLQDVKYNISEISFLLGYKDPSYFVRVFRIKTGTTPRRFRKDFNKTYQTKWLHKLDPKN